MSNIILITETINYGLEINRNTFFLTIILIQFKNEKTKPVVKKKKKEN